MKPIENALKPSSAILLIHCQDSKGIVSSVSEFIFKNNGNIMYLDQHVDTSQGVFLCVLSGNWKNFRFRMRK